MVSISIVSHASYLPFSKVGLELNIRRRTERVGRSQVGDLQQMENEIDSAKCFMCVSVGRGVVVVVCVRSLCKDKV